MDFKAACNFILDCPILERPDKFNIDLAGSEPITYSFGPIPPVTISTTIAGTKTIRRGILMLATRDTGKDNKQRLEAFEQGEKLAGWVNEQGEKENFPSAAETGETIVNLYAQNPMRLDYEGGTKVGLYQVQIFIEYKKEAI